MTCDQDDLRSPQSDQLGREDVQQQDLRGTNDDIRLENGSGVGSLGKRKREEEASEQTGLHHTSDEARSKRRKRPMGGYLGLLGHQPTAQHPPKAAKDIKPAKNDKSTSVLVRLYDLPINEDSEFMTQLTDALIADSDAREAERVASTTTIAEKPQTTSNPTTFPNLTQENIRREYQHTVNTQTKPNVENRTVCSSVDGLTKSMAPSTPLKSVAIDAPSLHLTAQNSDQDFKQTAPDADCAAPSHTVGKEERKCGNNQGLNNTCVIEHKRELVNANPILQ